MVMKKIDLSIMLSVWVGFLAAFLLFAEGAYSQQVKSVRFCVGHHRLRPYSEYSAKPGEKLSPQRNSYHCRILFRVPRADQWVKHDVIFVPDDAAFRFDAGSFRREKSEKHGELPEDAGYPESRLEDRDPALEKRYGGYHIYRRYEILAQNKMPGYRTGVGFANRGYGQYIFLIRDATGEILGEYRFRIQLNEASYTDPASAPSETTAEPTRSKTDPAETAVETARKADRQKQK